MPSEVANLPAPGNEVALLSDLALMFPPRGGRVFSLPPGLGPPDSGREGSVALAVRLSPMDAVDSAAWSGAFAERLRELMADLVMIEEA